MSSSSVIYVKRRSARDVAVPASSDAWKCNSANYPASTLLSNNARGGDGGDDIRSGGAGDDRKTRGVKQQRCLESKSVSELHDSTACGSASECMMTGDDYYEKDDEEDEERRQEELLVNDEDDVNVVVLRNDQSDNEYLEEEEEPDEEENVYIVTASKSYSSCYSYVEASNTDRAISSNIYSDNNQEIFPIKSSSDRTAYALLECKHKIIAPIKICLAIIGWRIITTKAFQSRCPHVALCINALHFAAIFTLHFGAALGGSACCVYLKVKKDIGNHTNFKYESHCEHFIVNVIVPNLLQFIVFLIGVYFFRVCNLENLYALMEKTFEYQANLLTPSIHEQYIIRGTRIYLGICGGFIVIISVFKIIIEMNFIKFDNLISLVFQASGHHHYQRLIVTINWLFFIGIIVQLALIFTTFLLYFVNCNFILAFVKMIIAKIKMRNLTLQAAKKDVLQLGNFITNLNQIYGVMTTLILFAMLLKAVEGIFYLWPIFGRSHLNISSVLLGMLGSILPTIIAIYQANKINQRINFLKTHALNIMINTYRDSCQSEIASYAFFIQCFRNYVKILGIDIKPTWIYSFTLILSLGFVVYTQNYPIIFIDR